MSTKTCLKFAWFILIQKQSIIIDVFDSNAHNLIVILFRFFSTRTLNGHTGSVLCLQYDERVIISGSSDSTVRVWDVHGGDMVNTLIHHCEAVLVMI